MKKTIVILAAFVLALGLTQCKKEQAPTTATEENGIRITLDLGSNSRAQVDPNNPQTNGEVSWAPVSFETNDTIYVGYKGSFVGKLGFNSNKFNGTLDGNLIENLGVDGESHLHFYLLGGKGFTPTPTSTGFTVDISDQTDRYPVIAYAASNEAFSVENTTYTAKLKHKASIMKFDVTTPSSAAICITGMNNKVTLNFNPETEGTDEGFTYGINTEDGGLIKMPAKDESNETWAIVLPQGAYEEEGAEGTVYSEDHSYTGKRPVLPAIQSNKYLADGIAMTVTTNHIVDLATLTANYVAQDGDILINTLADNYKISVNTDNATITLRGATINGNNNSSFKWAGITCQNNTTIILEGTNTVKGFYEDYPGIHIAANKTLTIQGSGSLTASSNGFGAGIGGGFAIACGNIVINGGTINAIGGDGKINNIYGAAGIGSGYNTSCGFISINNENGTVEATGGAGGGAGIGSGYKGICGNITIDGTVTATGGYDAAGIGSGFNQNRSNACGMITINQGTIKATGGYRAAGIGTGNVVAGQTPTCSGIFITGGDVEARGGDEGAGIGVGSLQNGYADCGGISISGGSVTAIGGGCAAGIGSGCVHRDATSISTCGDISITGGTVIATGGAANDTYQGGAGIGTGSAISSGGYTGNSNCGNITIANTVTSVKATMGSGAQNSIGKNHSDNPGTCGTVEIGGTVTGNISTSPYTYQP